MAVYGQREGLGADDSGYGVARGVRGVEREDIAGCRRKEEIWLGQKM